MLFPTVEFALFFLLVGSIYWALGPSWTRQKLFLLLASYVFYGWWDWRFIALIFASTLVHFHVALRIRAATEPSARRAWLLAVIAGNIGLLGFFKYYAFAQTSLDDLARALGLPAPLPVLEITLPIGISFFTFQCLAYVIDVYRERAAPATTLVDFMLFVSFFPQLVAGPICRTDELLPQIQSGASAPRTELHEAIVLICSGLLKKAVISTFIATHLVDHAFLAPENYSALELLVAAYGYTAVVYCDFSGYTDLARGTSLLLGFRLPENFRGPYAATNIGDFWRRWHITFSRWLRDYIYFPLGGARRARARTYLNLFLTFLFGGLWHGADWKFVIWGAIHGLALAAYKASLDLRRARGIDPSAAKPVWYLVAGWLLTLNLCVFARVFFRAPDLPTAGRYFRSLAELSIRGQGVELAVILATIVGIGLSFCEQRLKNGLAAALERTPRAALPIAWAALAVVVIKARPTDVAPYIYFQF